MASSDFELPLPRFLERVADPAPSPSAGSASAVTAAMAASLLEMTARQSDVPDDARRARELRGRLQELAAEDVDAYRGVLEAEGDARATAMSRATDVPVEIAAAAGEVAALAQRLAHEGKGHLRGDAGAGAILAAAAARACSLLVAVNLSGDESDERISRADELAYAASAAAAGVRAEERPASEWALTRRVELSGGEIAWDVFGEGPPLVLVHGTPTWSYLWRNVVPALAPSFAVHVYDLAGYGDSPAPRDGDLSLATHADTLVELLDHWGLEAPAIVGHDIGGGTVLRAHLLHGRRFERIALVDAVALAPWITGPTRHIQANFDVYATMPNHIFERVVAAHLRTAVHRDPDAADFAAYLRPWRGAQGQEAYLRKVAQFDEEHTREFESLLETIEVPVLIVWGRHDAWLAPELAEKLGRTIPRAQVRLIDGAGHFAPEDAPAEVAEALLEFLEPR